MWCYYAQKHSQQFRGLYFRNFKYSPKPILIRLCLLTVLCHRFVGEARPLVPLTLLWVRHWRSLGLYKYDAPLGWRRSVR